MAINKFFTLNQMQKSLTVSESPFFSVTKTWELKASHAVKAVKRSRCVTFITKSADGYHVTLTGITHNTFMGALASVIGAYANELYKLISSMVFPAKCDITKHLNPLQAFEVPEIPVYDRGAKKEYLHPLRRAVTKLFGGVYHR